MVDARSAFGVRTKYPAVASIYQDTIVDVTVQETISQASRFQKRNLGMRSARAGQAAEIFPGGGCLKHVTD